MNKKSLSLGMVIPLAAAGAVATAPGASALSSPHSVRHLSRVTCDLDADALRGDRIRVVFTLDTHRSRDRGVWRVQIKQNGREIETDWKRTRDGRLRVVDYTFDRKGTDWFSASAYNHVTRQWCSARDEVRSRR